jgi:hypothetical protein
MIKPYQRTDPTRTTWHARLGLMVIFVILFTAISAYFTSSLVDDYKQHMLVRDHGADTFATITGKHISRGGRSTSYNLEYSFVAPQGSSRANAAAVNGALKPISSVSEDVRRSVFDAYDVGSKIRIRYATSQPSINFLHIDDDLDTKGFQTGEIFDGIIFVAISFIAAAPLALLAWIPWLIWLGIRQKEERKLRYEREAPEIFTKYEPNLGRARRED